MAILDGIKQLFLRSAEPTGLNPATGRIFKWIEKSGSDYIYYCKDENGAVKAIGTTGGADTFKWMLQAGCRDLPSNGTEQNFGYGIRDANDGVTMMRAGHIGAMSVLVKSGHTSGAANFIICINGVNNNVAGQRIIIDGSSNGEGGVDSERGYIIFSSNLEYVAGDVIEVKAITSSWAPTNADATVLAYFVEVL